MPGERSLPFTRPGVPEPYRPIPTSAGKGLPIRAKRYACRAMPVTGKRPLEFARFGIAHPHGPVPTPADKRGPIRTKRYTQDRPYMARE